MKYYSNMASRLLNASPNDAQRSALNKMLARQESAIAHLQGMREEDERERKRYAANVALLHRSAIATGTFRDIGTQISEQLSPTLIKIDELLLTQEKDHADLSALVPATKTLLTDWTTVKRAIATLLADLEEPMKKTKEFVLSMTDELRNAEVLQDQITGDIATLSEMIQCGAQSIASTKEGILHPLRRLPDEILLLIFGECIEKERYSLREMLPRIDIPRLPSKLAAVCKRWRQMVRSTPYFWNYICFPPSWAISQFESYWKVVRPAVIAHSMELTVPLDIENAYGQSHDDDVQILVNFHRLNITNVAVGGLPPGPCSSHLWIGHSGPTPVSHVIPATLISSTVRLTCLNVLPIVREKNQSIRVICIRGAQFGSFFGSMMTNLPQLRKVNMTQLSLGPLTTTFNRDLMHHSLSHLAIHASALDMIDLYLMRGLRLPGLCKFAIKDIGCDAHSASNYPSITSQFKPAVRTLKISGTSHRDSVLSWIEALLPLEKLVANGEEPTLVITSLLYRTSDPEADSHNETRLPLKGLTSLVICEYTHDCTSIFQQLKDIRRNPHPETPPINIVFKRCPNILPSIRAEILSKHSPLPEITVGPSSQ